ncbi:MAG TPA: ATP-binding protein [Pirellulales bacterium]
MGDRQHPSFESASEEVQRAVLAEKHAALARLATGMVHEFNNHLMVVVGNAELGLLTAGPDSPAKASLERILSAGERAAEFCKQIMGFAGRCRLELCRTDLNRLLGGLQASLAVAASQATLRWQLAEPLPAIDVDRAQLTRLIEHLVANAAEALPPTGGSITLSTGTLSTGTLSTGSPSTGAAGIDGHSVVWPPEGDFPPGPGVYLQVADTGAGMDRATIGRALDPFFSTRGKGRGLGLAAVLGIARAHRATLCIESQPGQGTRVRVCFPLPDAASEAGTQFSQAPAWRGSGRALVIDADDSARTVSGALLEHFGFDTLLAADVPGAAALVREHPGPVRLILLAAPTAEVGKLLGQLRELEPSAKILLIGADAASGADGCVPKPFGAAQLAGTLQSLLG